MVPANSNGASPTPPYSGYRLSPLLSLTGLSPSLARFPTRFRSALVSIMRPYYPPQALTCRVWALARSLATTCAITVVFSSSGYLDVSVPRVCPPCGVARLQRAGLPHSDTCGSAPVCGSPQLFAAYHVLLRLREPRHPPCALLYFFLCAASRPRLFLCSSRFLSFANMSMNLAPRILPRGTAPPRTVVHGGVLPILPFLPPLPREGVENIGVEPMTSCLQSRRSSQLS